MIKGLAPCAFHHSISAFVIVLMLAIPRLPTPTGMRAALDKLAAKAQFDSSFKMGPRILRMARSGKDCSIRTNLGRRTGLIFQGYLRTTENPPASLETNGFFLPIGPGRIRTGT